MCASFKVIQKRILIIDDDIDLLMLLERRLDKEGFCIETAASLAEAEEVVYNFEPELILLDINVKGEDGRKLCWKLKMPDAIPEVKIILMSGYDYSTSRAVIFGADDLVPKPLNFDFLLHRISLHMSQFPDARSLVMPGQFKMNGH
jgi:DNA-binding response OmpR family regulator